MKPAVLRPRELRDQQGEVRYCREQGGPRRGEQVAKATNAALDQIELESGWARRCSASVWALQGFATWRVGKSPPLRCYFERGDRLDVIGLLGERQDIIAIWGDESAPS